jgi:hypothetical protein
MSVWIAASAAINALQNLGYTSCFVGGVACALHGNSRTPKVCHLTRNLVFPYFLRLFSFITFYQQSCQFPWSEIVYSPLTHPLVIWNAGLGYSYPRYK